MFGNISGRGDSSYQLEQKAYEEILEDWKEQIQELYLDVYGEPESPFISAMLALRRSSTLCPTFKNIAKLLLYCSFTSYDELSTVLSGNALVLPYLDLEGY